MKENQRLESAISEYKGLVPVNFKEGLSPAIKDRLISALSREHDWTEEGAASIVSLASDYGAFVLRNALALAIALDIEDGALGL
jgi:hypothetical protein